MIFDLHNDFPTVLSASEYRRYIEERSEAVITAAIWTSEWEKSSAATKIKGIRSVLSDVPTAIEDMSFAADETSLSEFDFRGLLYCSLTWNYNNGLAGGALDDGDLTDLGKKAVSLMNGKCAVDLAHLNEKSFYSVLDAAERPICSHTGFGDHPRCLDEKRIRALTDRNGLVGLCAVKRFTGAETADAIAEQIDRFVQKYGVEYLCVGTDFNGSVDLPSDFKDYCDLPNLIFGLRRRGYSSADMEKILYGNAERLYKETYCERHL